MTKEITEADLISLVMQRSTYGFSVLYDKYANIVFDVVMRIVRDEGVAEDILEKTLVKVWGDISEYNPHREGLLSWIISIAQTMSMEHGSYSGRGAASDDEDIAADTDQLSIEAIELIFLKGYTYEEASKLLDTPIDVLKNSVRTELKQIRSNHK